MYRTILVATDGSDYAGRAVRRAIALADDHSATLHVLAVVDRRVYAEPSLSTEELVTIEMEDHYTDCLADAQQQAATAGIDVECAVAHGVPYERIIEYADEIDADVILVGAHGDPDEHFGRTGAKVRQRSDREVRKVTREG